MSVVLIGSVDDPEKVDSWIAAVLPNRKVLSHPDLKGLGSQIEHTIRVRSEFYTEQTGEEHMPVEKLFREVMHSWNTQGVVAGVFEDDIAKKHIQEAGLV